MKPLFKYLPKMVLLYSIFLTSTFHTSAQTWNQIIKVTAQNNGGSSARNEGDFYGRSVSISGNYAIVGAHFEDRDANGSNFAVEDSGSAYIFNKDQGGADNWGQIQKITASNRGIQDRFGHAVCINGDYAIVGDPFEKDIDYPEANTIFTSGSAYIFKKDQGGAENWGQVQKLTASVRNRGDNLGNKVAISGDHAIVGAPYQKEDAQEANTLYSSGAAYIFKKDQSGADNWGQVKKITASPRAAEDFFGRGVSISGEYVIVGTPGEDQDTNELNTLMGSGSAYIFKKEQGGTDNWGQVQKITASVRASSDFFANSVAIDGNHLIVGAPAEDHDTSESNTTPNAGSAYIFNYTPPLPVTLTTFKAVKNENQALLTWATTMESNSDYFDIQKSASGFSWKTLKRVPAAMNSDQHRTYSFIPNYALGFSNA